MKDSTIIFGFPGVGKTYCFEHQKDLGLELVDSDSSKFHWIYDMNGQICKDENGNKREHPEWPMNYIRYVTLIGKEKTNKPDYIMMSTHAEVIEAMLTAGFDNMCFVVPSRNPEAKAAMMEIYKKRGNSQAFIDKLFENYDQYIADIINKYQGKINLIFINPHVKEARYSALYDVLSDFPVFVNPMEFDEDKE